MKKKQIMAVILAAGITVSLGGVTANNVIADSGAGTKTEANDANTSSYEAIKGSKDGATPSDEQYVGDFQFTSGINVNATTAYFCDSSGKPTEEKVNSTGDKKTKKAVTKKDGIIIQIPQGFKYYTKEKDGSNTYYDVYVKITPLQDISYDDSDWTFSVGNVEIDGVQYLYYTIQPNTKTTGSFNYEIWLQNDNTVVSDVDLVAGSCFTATSEGAKPYGDTGALYTNIPKNKLQWNSTYSCWAPTDSNYNKANRFILGHGRGSDNHVKGGYVRKSGGGGAEMVVGYLTKTVTFKNEENAPAGKLSFETEEAAVGKVVSVPTSSPNEGFFLEYWDSDSQATLSDDTVVPVNERISPRKFLGVKVTDDITFTAHYAPYEFEINDNGDTLTMKYEKGTDSEWLKSLTTAIKAENMVYDGEAYDKIDEDETDRVTYPGLEEKLKELLPSASIDKVTYYTRSDGETSPSEGNITTVANSGASGEGAAPVKVGKYWVKATISTTLGDEEIYTSFEITPCETSVEVEGITSDYDGTAQKLVDEDTVEVNSGTIYYSTDKKKYDKTIPTATNADTYTVYYYVVGNEGYTDVGSAENPESVTSTINKKAVTVTPDNKTKVYGGEEKELTYTITKGNLITGDTLNVTLSREAGEDVEDYTITATLGENPNYNVSANTGIYSITPKKASAAVTANKDLVYDGTPKTLVTLNSVDGGTVYYSVDGGDFKTDIPTGTNAGEYKVTYYVVGDKNHSDSDKTEVTVKIAEADMDGVTASDYNAPYDGQYHTISVDAPDGAKVTYLNGEGEYVDDAPTYKDVVDKAEVSYKVEMENYGTVTGTKTVTITKKSVTASVTADNKDYDGTTDAVINVTIGKEQDVVDGDTITITGLTGSFDTADAGNGKEVTVNSAGAVITGADNYNVTIPQTVSANINQIASTADVAPKELTYTGDDQVLVDTGNLIEGTKIHYSLDGENWVDEIPTGNDAGEYTIYYYVEGDNNHYDLGSKDNPKTVTVTIAQKSITGATVTLGDALIYNGQEQTQSVLKVTLDGIDLPADAYEIIGNVGTDPGTYTMTIRAKDGSNYKDEITCEFVISPKEDDQPKADDQPKDDSAATDTGKTQTVTSVNTGDPSGVFTYAGTMVASLGAAFGALKLRRKKKDEE